MNIKCGLSPLIAVFGCRGTLTEAGRSIASAGMMKFLKPFLIGENEEDNKEEEQQEADDDVDSGCFYMPT